MSRRLLLPLLAALALLLAGAPAALAAGSPATAGGGPSARIADAAPDDGEAFDDGCSEDADGALVCEDDWSDGTDGTGDDGDVDELCDDDWSDDEDDGSDEDADSDAEISTADDGCDEESGGSAPRVASLRATVAGAGARARVRVAFRLDRAGTVRLTLERVQAAASRGGKRCANAAGTSSGNDAKHGRTGCGVALRGSIDVHGRSGANSTELPRRWNGRRLAPGSYRLTAAPVASGGAGATTSFKLAAAAKR